MGASAQGGVQPMGQPQAIGMGQAGVGGMGLQKPDLDGTMTYNPSTMSTGPSAGGGWGQIQSMMRGQMPQFGGVQPMGQQGGVQTMGQPQISGGPAFTTQGGGGFSNASGDISQANYGTQQGINYNPMNVRTAGRPAPAGIGRPAPTYVNGVEQQNYQGGGDVFSNAAAGLNQAMQGTQQGMNYQPMNVSANQVYGQGYKPAMLQSTGYNAALAGSQGYTAERATAERAAAERAASQGYDAERVAGVKPINEMFVNAGQLSQTNLQPYLNPYTSAVTQQTLQDLERSRQIQQNQLGAQAQAAGAFGGSRQGVAEAETNRAFAEQAAKTAAQLNQAGFTQAQQAAQQDIANAMQANLANQQANLAAQTTTGAQSLQAQLANQAAGNTAAQFGAQAANTAALQNAQLGTQAALQNAQLGTNVNLANQAAANQAAQFGASAANTAALQNAAAQNAAAQFGASAANQAAQLNQASLNQAGQFGASAQNAAALANQQAGLQAALANQSAGLQGAQMRLGAANQMGNLANLGFGMGQQTQAMQQQSGTIAQAINQALIDAAKGQWGGYTGAPAQSLGYLASALGATPNVSTTTNSRQPGLFDYLTLAATAAGGK